MKGLHRFYMSLNAIALWFGMFPIGWALRKIPITFSYRAASIISLAAYLIAVRRRRILKEEVAKLFGLNCGAERVRKIVLRSFGVYLKRQVDNIVFDRMSEKRMQGTVTVEGWHYFERAEEKKRGVIVLLSHFGSFLMPLPFLAYKGYRVYQLAGRPLIGTQDFIRKRIFEARKSQTDKMPFTFLLAGKFLGPVVRALRKGHVVVIAFDGRAGTEMIPMTFLNRTAQFSPGPFKLAFKTGSFILPTFVLRDGRNRHRIIFDSPMTFENKDGGDEAVKTCMVKFLEIFERYVSKYPCHFAMTLFGLRNEAAMGLNPPLFLD